MPSTTESGLTTKKTKISAAKLMGKEEGDVLGKVGQGSDKAGSLPRIVRGNKKAIAINAKKITLLKNISKSQSKRISGDTVGDKLPGGGGLKDILGDIASSMDGIRDNLIDQNKIDKKSAIDQRKEDEKKKRSLKESALEGVKSTLKSAGEAMLKPFKSLWDTVLDFLKTIFFGRVAVKLFDWIADPKNTDKIKSIFRFIKDWWPVIVAGIMAVVGPGVTFTIGAIALVTWATVKIVDAVKSVFGFGKDIDKELKTGSEQTEKDILSTQESIEKQMDAKINDANKEKPDVDPVETPDPDAEQIPTQEMAKGGEVPGKGDKDTVPAMLTPGEFVMSKGAVGTWGRDMLEGMNSVGGGTNKPKKDNEGVTHAGGGGLIGGIKSMASGMFGGGKDKDKTPEGSLKGLISDDLSFNVSGGAQKGTSNKDMGNEPSAIAGIAEGVPYTFEQQLQTMIIRHKWRTEELNQAIQSGEGVESTKRRHARATRGLLKYKDENPKVFAQLSADDKKYVDLSVKSDPLPTQTPTPWKKFVGSGGEGAQSMSTSPLSGGGGTSANVSVPPPVTSVKPPVKRSSTIAYAEQKDMQGGGKPATLDPSQDLPLIDAGAMVSGAKIKVLGISV